MTSLTQSPIQTQRICSIGLTVTDCDRARDFYTQALGFQVVADTRFDDPSYCELQGVDTTRIRVVALRLGDESIRLMQYMDLSGQAIPTDSQSNDRWFQHFAVVVSDLDRACAQVQRFPIQPTSTAPQTIPAENPNAGGVRAFKFKDPDGHDLELIHFPPDKGQDKWHQPTDRLFLGIDHTAIAVADTEQSLRFYRDLLGLDVEADGVNWRETQARLDGLENARVRVTALRPAQGGLGLELLNYHQPGPGRPIPPNWDSADIAHVQTELVVADLAQAIDQLRRRQVAFVSPPTQVSGMQVPGQQGCVIRDPSSHAILLMQAPR
ncbi:VOC family protein [Nodosilinea nodulosa]|uniref:VOC family protein n=1 Tax=Nodosilinea nodulosa TaxID=416001 RepID=UPI0002FB8C5B|nr:VOC family protein [Nodosilinea nodulosa]